ncbi:hypothetical protein ACQ4PT_029447 [Festuca glaucescens]
MEGRVFGLENPLMTALQHLLDIPDGEAGNAGGEKQGPTSAPWRRPRPTGERQREEKEDAKYLRMERRMGKLMRKFVLPENADMEKISAVCRDGVLTVSVEKLPPPEPKKPKTIQVQVA